MTNKDWKNVQWVIARLEAAEKGSDSLDRDIAGFLLHATGFGEVLPFSTSIDAALTLLPTDDHYMWAVGTVKTSGPYAANIYPGDTDGRPTYQGATPAIALVIAALKARGETP